MLDVVPMGASTLTEELIGESADFFLSRLTVCLGRVSFVGRFVFFAHNPSIIVSGGRDVSG